MPRPPGLVRRSALTAAELVAFRRSFHGCLPTWGDALFELCDAALCSPGRVCSVPALSLESAFRRSHGSLYKALAFGSVDEEAMRELLVAHRPKDWPLIFAVDASTWGRRYAATSPDRGFYYSPSANTSGRPVVAGWNYQWICQLNWAPDSWTAPTDVLRIKPDEDATTATVAQIRRLVGRFGASPASSAAPVFVFDAGYDPIALGAELADVHAQVVVRMSPKRVFHADPPVWPAGTPGRPPRHGARFALSEPDTHTMPDGELEAHDARYGTVKVRAWRGLHPKLKNKRRWIGSGLPIVRGTVVRVDVERLPRPPGHVNKTLWLWWSGPDEIDLDLCWRAYLRRFDIEHAFRFLKSTLGWTTPALRMPEQADRWTWLVVIAYTQLRLARGLVDDLRLPWEKPLDPSLLTPTRVRRGFHQLRHAIGTPTHAPKSVTPGPGRPKGTKKPPRTRYPIPRRDKRRRPERMRV
jgi:DDE superfamily endonuclease